MSLEDQYNRQIVSEYRNGNISEKDVLEWAKKLQKEEVKARKPDIKNLKVKNDPVQLPDIVTKKLGNIEVHGEYCHPIFAVLNNMMVSGMSPVVFIVGDRRLGKSKTALYMAKMMHQILGITQGSFRPQEQLIYDDLEFLLLIATSQRIVQIADEAHRYLHWQDQRSSFVRAVSSVLDTMAIHNNLHIVVTPKYKKIASGIRDHVDFMVEMKDRQFAEVTWYKDKYGKKGNRGLDFEFDEFPYWNIPDIPDKEMQEYEEIEDQYKYQDHLDLIIQRAEEKIQEKEEARKKRF